MAFGDALAREASGTGFSAWCARFFLLGAFCIVIGIFADLMIFDLNEPRWLVLGAKIFCGTWLALAVGMIFGSCPLWDKKP